VELRLDLNTASNVLALHVDILRRMGEDKVVVELAKEDTVGCAKHIVV
jgi:hypothetical protein